MAELNSFLKGIADAIRSKKGTTDKINASNFANEIASITGGGGAVIKTIGGWQGTAVPESGLVDKVYFNTNLSVEEVVEIAQTLTFAPVEGVNISACFTDATMDQAIVIMKHNAEEIGLPEDVYLVMFAMAGSGGYLFQSQNVLETDWIGWNPEFTGVLDVNMENMLSLVASYIGYTPENEKASSLFSSTPFVKSSGESVSLSGEYDGSSITIEKLKGGWEGTPVPSSGQVNNIYINTKLSKEEVVSICDNLTFVDGSSVTTGFDIWSCATNSALTNGIMVARSKINPEIYAITVTSSDGVNEIFFSTIGWTESASDVFAFNDNNQISVVGPMLGLTPENEKATNLFSSTPFVEKKANVLYLKDYIEKQQIPLEINVKVRSGNAVITTPKYIGTQVPNSGTVENVYFNTELSVEETNNIITNAGFTVNQTYPILTKSDKSNAIVITNNSSGQYAILDAAFTAIYFHSFLENEADFGFIGWNPNITMPIAINSEVISELDGTPSGNFNNLITSLFSTTPFEIENETLAELGGEYASTDIEITEDGIIDVLEIINNQEAIPTKIITTSAKNFILGDISEYNDMYFLKEARVGLFAESNITNANLPYLEKIPQYMFYSCKELTAINCPKAEYISKCAFYECKQLTSIDFPEASRIGDHAFYQSGIKNFNLPKVHEIDGYAFSWTPIEHFESSEVSNIGPYSFAVCYNLISVKLPKVTDLNEAAFEGCSVLKSVDLPAVTRIYGSAFQTCYELNNVKFPNLTKLIGDRIFASCKALTDLYFGKYVSIPGSDTVLTLPGHTVTIHVRSEHLEQYEAVGTSWHQLTVTGRVVIVGDYTD